MIKGVHTMFYTAKADELRAFLRDKLGFGATDVGGGWLIFDLPQAEMGVHPSADMPGKTSGTHDISFYTERCTQDSCRAEGKGRRVHQRYHRPGLRPGHALPRAGGI